MSEEKKFQTVEPVEPEAPVTSAAAEKEGETMNTETTTKVEETKKKNWFVRAASTIHNYTTGWVWRKVITPSYKWTVRSVVKPAWSRVQTLVDKTPTEIYTPVFIAVVTVACAWAGTAAPFTMLYTCAIMTALSSVIIATAVLKIYEVVSITSR